MRRVDAVTAEPTAARRRGTHWPDWVWAALVLVAAGLLALAGYRGISRALAGESVSYTNLDVYKRQVHSRPLFIFGV